MNKDGPDIVIRSSLRGSIKSEEEKVNISDVLDAEKSVGDEIHHLRRAREITLVKLSNKTGLSQGYLSQIERGLSRPSIKALHAISRALGVNISWFFKPVAEGEEELKDIVVRTEKRRSLKFKSGITDELLSPNLGRKIEMLRCTFEPGSESGEEAYTHRGEEAGIILSGCLHLWLDNRKIVLNEGDSFAFSSQTPHRYKNPTDEITIVIWTMTPPSY